MAIWSRIFQASLIAVVILIGLDLLLMTARGRLPIQPLWFLAQCLVLAFAAAGLLSIFGSAVMLLGNAASRSGDWLTARIGGEETRSRLAPWIALSVWVLVWVALANGYLRRMAHDIGERPGFLRLEWFATVQPLLPLILFTAFAAFAFFIALPILMRSRGRLLIHGTILLLAGLFLYLDGFFLVGYYHLYHRVLGILALVLLCVLAYRGLEHLSVGDRLFWLRDRRLALFFGVASVIALTLIWSGSLFRSHAHMDSILFETTHLRRAAIELREATDADGDGFSRILGGGDPDDGNSAVHPLAVEISDDGIDQDGDGHDQTQLESEEIQEALQRTYGESSGTLSEIDRVILITIDAIRPDRLGRNAADGQPVCPVLDSLATQSVRFSNAYSPTAATVGTFRAILTTSMFAPDSTYSLFDELHVNGVKTAVIAPSIATNYLIQIGQNVERANEIVASETIATGEDILRGKVHLEHPTSYALTDSVVSYLSRTDGRSFTWIHFYDLHQWNDLELDETTQRLSMDDRYDAVLRLVDTELGRLLSLLRAAGAMERTAILISADHGESLGERGIVGHGYYVWEAVVRVPLLILVPGLPSGDVLTPVSLLSLGATIGDLFGFELAPNSGPSLVPLLGEAPNDPVPLFLDEWEQIALVEGEWKLLYGGEDRRFRLHNLKVDPDEEVNLIEQEPERFHELKAKLADRLRRDPYLFRHR